MHKDSVAVRRAAECYPGVDFEYVRQRLWYSTFVNFERRYLYFEIPKSACTYLKSLIHRLEGLPLIEPYVGEGLEVRRDMFIHERSQFALRALVDFDDATQEEILDSPDFFRFTVVRNPYARLLSAFRDKVLVCSPQHRYIYHAVKGDLPRASDLNSFLSFGEFVDWLTGEDLRFCDSHWRSQSDHIFHNALNLGFIGRTESMSDVVETLCRRVDFPAVELEARANVSVRFGTYDEHIAARVYDLYVHDFETFGYEKDSWKSSARETESGHRTVPETRLLEEITERNIVIGHLYSEIAALRKQKA